MNRVIKFRGKRLDNGEWIEGSLCESENQTLIVYDRDFYEHEACGIKNLVADRYFEVDPSTVGEFTGLLDKNGKEIFEGDIIQFESINTVVVAKVVCKIDRTGFVGCFVWEDKTGFQRLFDKQNLLLVIVIGNIFKDSEQNG